MLDHSRHDSSIQVQYLNPPSYSVHFLNSSVMLARQAICLVRTPSPLLRYARPCVGLRLPIRAFPRERWYTQQLKPSTSATPTPTSTPTVSSSSSPDSRSSTESLPIGPPSCTDTTKNRRTPRITIHDPERAHTRANRELSGLGVLYRQGRV